MTGRKKGFIVACVSVCVFIAAGGAAVAITEWSVRQKAQSQVLYQLSTIDDQIAKGHYAQAERLLDDLKDFSYDFSLYKEIMKRVFRIAEVQNRYERFLSFAQSAAAVLQKTAFQRAIDGLSACKRWPFARRKTAFCMASGRDMLHA